MIKGNPAIGFAGFLAGWSRRCEHISNRSPWRKEPLEAYRPCTCVSL